MLQQCSTVDFLKLANENGASSNKKHKRSGDTEESPRTKNMQAAPDNEDKSLPKTQPMPVTADPSGLFLIDSNPDYGSVLKKLAEESKMNGKKHKRDHEQNAEEVQAGIPLKVRDTTEQTQLTSKRKKVKHDEPNPEPPGEEEEYAAQLERKVVLRLKEKEEDSKKKANKKRKRESDASITDTPVNGVEHSKPPPSKKVKGKAAVGKPNPPKVQKQDQSTKKRKAEVDVAKSTSQAASKKKKKNKGKSSA